jgi:hypothetical protein
MVGGNMLKLIRRVMLNRIEEKGRASGAPIVNFPERTISIEGEDVYVGQKQLEWLFFVSAFYLALPPYTYGVVVYPDGTSHNTPGGLQKVPPGVYGIHYVDKHERTDTSEPVSEMTIDGEKLTLQVILRYCVVNPEHVLSIARPVETLMEHVEADVAQYIRTHDHSEIADSADNSNSRLFSFFSERHKRRIPLSDAISITGIELKEFRGDKEFVEMRRRERTDERQIQSEKKLEELQQELNRIKSQHKVENEKHLADLDTMNAHHQKEIQDIQYVVKMREIELDGKSKHLQRREEEFRKAIDAISSSFSSGYPTNPNVIATMAELVAALKEGVGNEQAPSPETSPTEDKSPARKNHTVPSASPSDKVEKLTNTLLNLLKPKK